MPPRKVTPLAYQVCPASLEKTDRAAWLALRRDGIGGSDIAAVAGLDLDERGRPRRTRWQVYLDKVGELDDDDRTPRMDEMAWFGWEMEAVAAKRFRQQHPGTRTSRVGMLARVDAPFMRVNLDWRVTGCPLGSPCLLEVKNRNAYVAKAWAADDDDEGVPDGPVLQTLWGLIVTGYQHGHLLAVIGGNELRPYTVRYNPDLAKTLIDEATWLWNECIVPRVQPPVDAAERTGRILAKLYEVDPDAVRVADGGIIARELDLRAAESELDTAKQRRDLLQHELMTWLRDGEIALDERGNQRFTWKQNSAFRAKAFRAEQPPEVVAKYTRLVEAIDTTLMAEQDKDLYRAYRARKFHLCPLPKDER